MTPRFDNLLWLYGELEKKSRRERHWYWRAWYRFKRNPLYLLLAIAVISFMIAISFDVVVRARSTDFDASTQTPTLDSERPRKEGSD